MEALSQILDKVDGLIWGAPLLIALMAVGIMLTAKLHLIQVSNLILSLKLVFSSKANADDASKAGDISGFAALCTALASTIGTGNIVGVATAVHMGGPGALFWMFVAAFFGMATKYSEVLLAVHYREKDKNGEYIGGPMFAIKNGLGKRWVWLGTAFAIFGGLAGFGIGNMVQVNSMAQALDSTLHIPTWITGVITTIIVAMVTLGGVKRIGKVAEALVPFMCVAYIIAGVVVLVVNAAVIPDAVALIFSSAFNPVAATGGFAGSVVMMSIRYGVARGVFSNEAGLGTAGIAQAAGTTKSAVRSGLIGMLGTFIDTLIVCSVTGLAIVSSGVWSNGQSGAALSAAAFESAMPGFGGILLTIALVIFAFTTILGWSYYGEKCWIYLVGTKSVLPFRLLWVIAVPFGAISQLDFAWLVADTLNGMMAIPNLLSLLLLSPVILKLTKEYFAKK